MGKVNIANLEGPRLLMLITLYLFLSIWPYSVKSQSQAEIRNVDFTVRNDSLFVTYDLYKASKKEQFGISLKITTASGKLINPMATTGDVGSNIPGGKAKQIIWNISKDNVVIDEEIAVEVLAIPHEGPVKFVSRGKAVLLSAIVPGLGVTKLSRGGPYWIMAIAAYGSAAGSYYYFTMAEQNYTKYLDAKTEGDRNSFHSTVQSQKSISDILMYTAGAV